MIKKTIKFNDFNGNELVEDFYFNLTKAELAEMELGTKGGMEKYITDIVSSEDGAAIMGAFKDILQKSYGVKSKDGRRFRKSEELWLDFLESGAYDILFMELVTEAQAAAEFINGIVPSDLSQKTVSDPRLNAKAAAAVETPAPVFHPHLINMPLPDPENIAPIPAVQKKLEHYTQAELEDMPQPMLLKLIKESQQ